MSGRKQFLISFLICLAAFSLIGWQVIRYVKKDVFGDGVKPGEDTDPVIEVTGDGDSMPVTAVDTVGGHSFGALVIGRDYATSETDALIFIKVDKENEKVAVCSIPVEAEYEVSGYASDGNSYTGSMSFKDTIAYYGADYLMGKLTALTGVKIDYYAIVSVANAKRLLNTLGAVTYTVPEDMEYEDMVEPIKLRGGEQNLDGGHALQLLRYRTYSSGNGDTKRRTTQVNFIRSLITQKLVDANKELVKDKMDTILSSCNTNVTAETAYENIDLVFSLADFEFENILFPYAKTVIDEGKVSMVQNIFKEYR